MNINGLDELDNKILTVIKDNARMDYTEISKHVGITRVAVKNRIKAMEEKGIIKGYRTIIEANQVPGSYEFYLDIQTVPEQLQTVVDMLKSRSIIHKIYSTTGECRLHAVGISNSPNEVGQFARSLYKNVRGITKLEWEFLISDLMEEKDSDEKQREGKE